MPTTASQSLISESSPPERCHSNALADDCQRMPDFRRSWLAVVGGPNQNGATQTHLPTTANQSPISNALGWQSWELPTRVVPRIRTCCRLADDCQPKPDFRRSWLVVYPLSCLLGDLRLQEGYSASPSALADDCQPKPNSRRYWLAVVGAASQSDATPTHLPTTGNQSAISDALGWQSWELLARAMPLKGTYRQLPIKA